MLPRSGGGYQRLDQDQTDVEIHHGSVAMTSLPANESESNPRAARANTLPPSLLKVLYKEKAYEIKNISGMTSVGQLKALIAEVTEVPPDRQRLIVAGRPMRPDEATLGSFKLSDNASVHLFPIPVQQPSLPVASSVPSSNASSQPIFTQNNSNRPPTTFFAVELDAHHTITPMHYDPAIIHTSNEVKMWCTVLIFLSAISLFNNLSYFSATGNFGHGSLDSFVFLLDTFCSAAGLMVGTLGLKSIRTLHLPDLRKYLMYLILLSLACIVLRIAWVCDVSAAVHKAYEESKEKHKKEGEGDSTPQMNHKAIVAFTMEATIIAMICIGAWVSCVQRAMRLHNAVQSYPNTNQNPGEGVNNPIHSAVASTPAAPALVSGSVVENV